MAKVRYKNFDLFFETKGLGLRERVYKSKEQGKDFFIYQYDDDFSGGATFHIHTRHYNFALCLDSYHGYFVRVRENNTSNPSVVEFLDSLGLEYSYDNRSHTLSINNQTIQGIGALSFYSFEITPEQGLDILRKCRTHKKIKEHKDAAA